MWGRNTATYVVSVGRIRRRGKGKHELCLDRRFPATQLIREAVENNKALFVELLMPDGSVLLVPNKPHIDRATVCVSLPARLNNLWETLWREKTMLAVRVVEMR